MKKKILSLVMSFCMVICSLFALTGCSVINTNKTKVNEKQVLKIGDTVLSKGDIVNSFYTYYQNNSSYFSYYTEEQIEESFYSWTIIREIISQKAKEELYNPETNADGKIIMTQDDLDDVKEQAFDYIYSQVSAYEKAIYSLAGVKEENYPIWLQTEDEATEDSKFEAYKSLKPEVEKKTTNDHKDKLSDEDIIDLIPALKERLFDYVAEIDEDDVKHWNDMDEDASDNIIKGARNEAYAQYLSYLTSNAKSNGKNKPVSELLEEEFLRVYNAYYDTKITTLYQNYWLEEYMVDTVNGDQTSLGDKAVVKAYLDNYLSDVETYQVEGNYINVMTSSDGASLVLYNFDGKYYYFTVQHILVKYDDYMTNRITEIPGYASSTSSDYDASINDNYVEERNNLTDAYNMMATVNQEAFEQFKDAIEIDGVVELADFASYYIYDENVLKNKEPDAEGNVYDDIGEAYIELVKTIGQDGVASYTYKSNGEAFTGDKEDIKLMISEENILAYYDAVRAQWEIRAQQYIEETDAEAKAQYLKDYESMAYVLEAAANVYAATGDYEQVNQKIASLLFVELQWLFSADTLGNELSNKLGYVISSMEDDNGSWVVDFAVGARDILKAIVNGDTSALSATNVINSNYGYHIIKVENIYTPGQSLVDMSEYKTNPEKMDIDSVEFVNDIIAKLKATYVSTSSNQTLYDYYYDTLYSELAGSSSASGTYFVALQYKWLADYLDADKVEYINKIGYQELMDAMS